MRSLKFRLTTMIAAMAVTATSFVPANSMPLPAAQAPIAQETVTNVQYRDRDRRERRWDRRESRRDYRRGYREGYHNGHRGYRERRSGYRYYNGYWFPLAAFAAGAVIGGAATQARPSASGSSHIQWCANRYRSYRASDNTFQPYNGPRQQCNSPY
jgi:BA14K-like protein